MSASASPTLLSRSVGSVSTRSADVRFMNANELAEYASRTERHKKDVIVKFLRLSGIDGATFMSLSAGTLQEMAEDDPVVYQELLVLQGRDPSHSPVFRRSSLTAATDIFTDSDSPSQSYLAPSTGPPQTLHLYDVDTYDGDNSGWELDFDDSDSGSGQAIDVGSHQEEDDEISTASSPVDDATPAESHFSNDDDVSARPIPSLPSSPVLEPFERLAGADEGDIQPADDELMPEVRTASNPSLTTLSIDIGVGSNLPLTVISQFTQTETQEHCLQTTAVQTDPIDTPKVPQYHENGVQASASPHIDLTETGVLTMDHASDDETSSSGSDDSSLQSPVSEAPHLPLELERGFMIKLDEVFPPFPAAETVGLPQIRRQFEDTHPNPRRYPAAHRLESRSAHESRPFFVQRGPAEEYGHSGIGATRKTSHKTVQTERRRSGSNALEVFKLKRQVKQLEEEVRYLQLQAKQPKQPSKIGGFWSFFVPAGMDIEDMSFHSSAAAHWFR